MIFLVFKNQVLPDWWRGPGASTVAVACWTRPKWAGRIVAAVAGIVGVVDRSPFPFAVLDPGVGGGDEVAAGVGGSMPFLAVGSSEDNKLNAC